MPLRRDSPGVVAAYAGVGTEPPTRELLELLAGAGATVLLPVIVGDRGLAWARFGSWGELVPGPRGLLQPRHADDVEPPELVDLVLAPALAVDRGGHRLGRGAGYYDRWLARARPSRVLAVVYDDEVLDEVPSEPHDVPVAGALTPSGPLWFRQ